jgi:hypothetical protein
LIVREDAFDLKRKKWDIPFVVNKRYEFLTDPQKIVAFRDWMKDRQEKKLLKPFDVSEDGFFAAINNPLLYQKVIQKINRRYLNSIVH